MFMQDLLHATEGDGSEVSWVLQLKEALEVDSRLTPTEIYSLAVFSIQSVNAKRCS